jgi:hypothetical protein
MPSVPTIVVLRNVGGGLRVAFCVFPARAVMAAPVFDWHLLAG